MIMGFTHLRNYPLTNKGYLLALVPHRNLNNYVYGKYMFFIVGKYSLDI